MNNLPPGVTDSMLPGNRPEDAEAEALDEELSEALERAMLVVSDAAFEVLSNWAWELSQRSFRAGYKSGSDDERTYGDRPPALTKGT